MRPQATLAYGMPAYPHVPYPGVHPPALYENMNGLPPGVAVAAAAHYR